MKTYLSKKYLLSGMLIVYVILNLVLAYFHEPWRDEAQVWLLCRDLSIPKLFSIMSYEGHSCLWHLINYPFAHFGLSIYFQNAIGLILVFVAAWLLLYKTNISNGFKAILLFSPLMTYHFPVIARCYSMAPLILFLTALFYKSRKEHPVRYALLVSLIVHIHVVMVITAFLLSLGFLIENAIEYFARKRAGEAHVFSALLPRFASLFLPLGSALILALQLFNIESSSLLHIKTASFFGTIERICEKIMERIMPKVIGLGGRKPLLLFLLIVVTVCYFIFTRMRKAGIIPIMTILGTMAFQFWLYAMAYDASIQRFMLFIFVLLMGIIIAWDYDAPSETGSSVIPFIPEVTITALLILMVVHMYPDIKYDVTGPYSGGIEAANYIDANIPPEALIITDNEAEVTAILPFSKTRDHFYYVPAGQDFSYVLWDKNWNKRCEYADFENWLGMVDFGDMPVYLISCTVESYIGDNYHYAEEYPLVFQSSAPSVKGEDYAIYRIH